MSTVIERVEFQAVAPKRALPGLEYTLNRLQALQAALKSTQAQLAGLSSNAVFKLSAKQYQDRAFNAKGVPVLKVNELARRLGFDPKDVRSAATLIETEIQSAIGKIQRAIDRNPAMGAKALDNRQKEIKALQSQSYFTDASSRAFKNSAQAGRFFERYAGLALANKQKGEQALAAILSGATMAPAGFSGGLPANLSPLVKEALAAASAAQDKTSAGSSKKSKKEPKPRVAHEAEGDDIVETRTTTPTDEKKPIRTIVKRLTGPGVIEETVHENDEVIKQTITDAVAKRAKAELQGHLAELKQAFKAGLPATVGRKNGIAQLVTDTTREADLLQAKYGPLGLGNLVENFKGQTLPGVLGGWQKQGQRAGASLDRQRNAAQTKEFLTEYQRRHAAQAALDQQRQKQQTANFIAEQKRQQDAAAALDKQRQKTTTKNFLAEEAAKKTAHQVASVQMTVSDLQLRGARRVDYRQDLVTGRMLYEKYLLAGDPNVYNVKYGGKGGAQVTASPAKAPKEAPDRLRTALGGLNLRDMAANFVKVGSWAVAVTALYKSVELATYSLKRMVDTGSEMAHLGVVFRGVGGSVEALTDDLIRLSAAEGRSTTEVMESAREWARLGGDRKAINEEVRVSAMAANIADMHMGETTRQLAALMHIYQMEAGDLNGVLGMLTNTSLKYNVTLEDLFGGLDRSAGAAKVAGVGLAELQGMIGTIVGKTGQSGIVVGNTIKSLLVQFSNPEIQRQLRGYGIEVLGNKLQQKPGRQVLGEMAAKWYSMDNRSKQDLTRTMVGRLSAARFVPLMDDYLQTQKLAVDGQLNMNRAQEANVKILETLKAQLAGVRSEFDRLIMNNGRGLMQDLTTLTRTGKNLLKFLHTNHPTGPDRPGLLDRFNDWMESPAERDASKNFEFVRQMQQKQGVAEGNAGRMAMFDFASGKLGAGKLNEEDVNLVASEMGADHAKQFHQAVQAGNEKEAKKVLADARERARQEGMAAAEERATAYNTRLVQMNATLQAQNKQITDKQSQGLNADQEIREAEELATAIHKLTNARDEDWRTESDINGELEGVFEMRQRYVNLLKEQAAAMEMVGRIATQVAPHTAIGGMDQQVAAAQRQLEILREQKDRVMTELPEGPERRQVMDEIRNRQKEVEATLAANQSPLGRELARQFDQKAIGIRAMERQAGGQRYGVDEGDKLNRERIFLQEKVNALSAIENRTEAQTGELEKAKSLQFENNLALRQRQVEVEREIHQLAIDQNKEFAKSFFGAGPAEMLRKLAAFRLAASGNVGMGQMMSMNPALRQDVGQLTGQNPDMRRLLVERNRLAPIVAGLPGFAEGGYTGPGNANEIAGVVHKGEFVLSQRDLFNLQHDNLYARGTRLLPGGGVYRPAGIPLDDIDRISRLKQLQNVLGPMRPGLRMVPNEMEGVRDFFRDLPASQRPAPASRNWGRELASGWRQWSGAMGRRASSLWGVGRNWASNPRNWLNAGKTGGMGLLGVGVTGGLNRLGGYLSPSLRSSDNYGGAAFGLVTDATGGAVAGARGGPLGMGIGAVGGMVVGDAMRYYDNARGIYQNTWGAGAMHKQVAAHQMALFRQQVENPKLGAEFEASMAARRDAAAKERAAFEAKMAKWDQTLNTPSQPPKSVDWLHPAAVVRTDDHVTRTYKMPDGRYANFYDGDQTPHYAPPSKKKTLPGFAAGGYTGDGPENEVAGVVHKGEIVIPKKDVDRRRTGGDTAVLENATAALDALGQAAHRVAAEFSELAARTATLFKGAGGGGGLSFAAPGQTGGWYPGKR